MIIGFCFIVAGVIGHLALWYASTRVGREPAPVVLPDAEPEPVAVPRLPEHVAAASHSKVSQFGLTRTVSIDLDRVPQWLVAGATGMGKSGVLNLILAQAVQRDPHDLQLVLIDPKRVELAPYRHARNLAHPVVTETRDAIAVLTRVVEVMEQRYREMEQAGVRHFSSLNVPRILCVVEEVADLMLQERKQVEPLLMRIAQLGRAAGINLILATQRPSVDVITGVLKANLSGRIALGVASATDSRVILDMSGAEQLKRPGDFILVSGRDTERGRAVFVTDDDVYESVGA